MSDFQTGRAGYQNLLQSELADRKQRNVNYSLRSFARLLTVSPGHLSLLIRGKKPLSRKVALKIATRLKLSPADRSDLLAETAPDFLASGAHTDPDVRILREDEFSLIGEWYHLAILSLGSIPGNRASSTWIARRLGITEMQALDAFNRLKRMGLIEALPGGRFRQSGKPLHTTGDIPSSVIRQYHRQNLDLARDELESVPIERKEYSSMTMAVNVSRIKKVKRMIHEFKQKVSDELEWGEPSEVYTLAVQLFPLSQSKGKPK